MRDAVILESIRTPFGKRGKALHDTHPVDLLGHLLSALVTRVAIEPDQIDDVLIGCVSQTGEQSANIARNAWLSAGLPESVPGTTLDRQCGSSLQALHFAAQGVMADAYDLVIAGGVESMTRVPLGSTFTGVPGVPLTQNLSRRYALPKGWFDQARGAEMIAQQWGFTREDLDRFSLESHRRAAAANFTDEIVPVPTDSQMVTSDEGIRSDTSLEQMASLPPAFPGLELITAGNASQISDGASATFIASREMADRLGLRPRARLVSFAVVGVDPVTMLIGPIPATHKVLERAGLVIDDIDLFEINEAFASVVLAWQHDLGVSWNHVNVNGGAIALGHPVGATGTRLIATLLHELERREGRYGLIAICEGGGMANGTIIERLTR
ncbi:MAG: acetyl-CoA C-acyltransferase [Chloroflexi bacterium AL-W]|nr:acetyl-CoA C-acyltransferase [Chloroflexi bacterium AL-N1]NOK67584.1 acetyl-CoA C-acyltransferase [Chloroflexi bacterium AL-N10]NOK75646.1 acetyl-CoA C-acyltransferase [Chloroflexi bacterium AL-N5]NOK82434.1 acetyl-CoA C-acyltransferase [Chloroflexi bacterium AL-W]NOK90279.1 acetyl-CoA C-acyltransferase [Chloroflexi bacterium AL-N15]